MTEDMPHSDLFSDGNEAVFSRLLAGELTEEERGTVDRRLQDDSGFRQAYLKWSILETDLETVLIDEPPPSLAKRDLASRHWGMGAASWSAIALALVAILVVSFLNWKNAAERKAAPEESSAHEDRQPPAPTVAVIAEVVDAPPGFSTGNRLAAGRVSLESGKLLVSFLGGAKLLLEGPSELVLRSGNHAELIHGRTAVRDSAFTRSFRLDLPDASLVDLGTEFAVKTGLEGRSVVRVQEGEVSVSVLGDDGATWVSEVVGASETVSLNPRSAVPLETADSAERFSRVPAVPRSPLAISEEYVRAVLAQKPVLYWRFDALDADGMVPDEGSLGCRGRLVNRGAPDVMTLAEGALHLKRTSQVRRVESERELPPVGGENLTVELWAQTGEVGWQTMFGMLVPGFPGEQRSSAVLEFAANTGLVHGPMAIRAVCRTPSGRTGGTNLFGEDLWMPGGWHHIVLTRGAGLAKLFVDGTQVGEARVPTEPDLDRYFVVLGQLHAINWQEQPGLIRQFVGALDECAVYDHVLGPEDVARHHRLGRSPDAR